METKIYPPDEDSYFLIFYISKKPLAVKESKGL